MDSGLGLRPPRNDSEGVIPGRSVREREGIHSASPDRGSPSLATLAGDDIQTVMACLVPVISIRKSATFQMIGITGSGSVTTREATYRSAFAVSANTLAIPPTPSISNKLTALMAGVAPSRI